MELIITENKNLIIAELRNSGFILNELQDFIDLLGNASYLEANCIILKKENLNPVFFDLRTGFAGEVLQKFSNYNQRLAIIGDFSGFKSKSLHDFIFESNKNGRILFVESKEIAYKKWR